MERPGARNIQIGSSSLYRPALPDPDECYRNFYGYGEDGERLRYSGEGVCPSYPADHCEFVQTVELIQLPNSQPVHYDERNEMAREAKWVRIGHQPFSKGFYPCNPALPTLQAHLA